MSITEAKRLERCLFQVTHSGHAAHVTPDQQEVFGILARLDKEIPAFQRSVDELLARLRGGVARQE